MSTLFPGAVDSFSTKVDSVTNVMAADVNNLQDSVVAIETAVIAQSPNPNLLYHTLCHDIWPEGVTFNDVADDSYVAGLWNTLWSGNAPDVSGEATVIAGSKRAIKALVDTNGTQLGFVQFLSNEDTVPLRGKTLSFSIDAAGFNVVNMRCAILEWTGTADAVTSDVVATWAVGNPTLATNWAFLGAAAASQALSGTTRIEAEGRTVGASANNLAVFVWTPDSEDSTDYVRLANAKLEIGLTATAFVAPNWSNELRNVQQFFSTSYDHNVAPGTAGGLEAGATFGRASSTSAISVLGGVFKISMRIAPAVAIYAYDGTLSRVSNDVGGGSVVGTTTAQRISPIGIMSLSDVGTPFTAGNIYWFGWKADARL